jgi:hypothetical protein
LGWSLTASGQPGEERTFLNFPMQGNESELLRLVFARAGDLPIIACAHDSFILEDHVDRIEQSNLRLSQSFVETAGVKKLLTTVRVGKPSPLIVTFSNNAAGSAVAIKELEHRIRWKRALHGGQEIYPLTKLTDAPWKTGFGMRRRPDFPILGWRQFIDGQLRIVEPLSLEAELGDSVPF